MSRPSFECSTTWYRQYKILTTYAKAQDKSIFPSPFPFPSFPGCCPRTAGPHQERALGHQQARDCSNERSRLISAAVPLPFRGARRTHSRLQAAPGPGSQPCCTAATQALCTSFSFCFPFFTTPDKFFPKVGEH